MLIMGLLSLLVIIRSDHNSVDCKPLYLKCDTELYFSILHNSNTFYYYQYKYLNEKILMQYRIHLSNEKILLQEELSEF